MDYGFQINGINVKEFGLMFKIHSFYSAILSLPKRKQPFYNNWQEHNGFDYDNSETGFEPHEFEIDCYMEANSVDDLILKRAALIEEITKPEGFTLYSDRLRISLTLRYLDSPSFRTLTPMSNQGSLYCLFQLKLQNNYDPAFIYKLLADNENSILLINDDEGILVKTEFDSRYGS